MDDHQPLHGALADADAGVAIVPLFVLDPRLVTAKRMSPGRLAYLADALAALDAGLRERGAHLILRGGVAEQVVPQVAREVQAVAVHWAGDVTPFSTRRDERVRAALAETEVVVHGGVMIHEPGSVTSTSGRPSKVYTPFRRAWERQRVSSPLPAPETVPMHRGVASDELPTRASLGVADRVPEGMLEGGEVAARARARRFFTDRAEGYHEQRDALAVDGTSRLSADLHYGCLSPRALYAALDRRKAGHATLTQELIWRDFYGHVMATWPEVAREEFNPAYRELPWHGDGEEVDAWREGRTGYPIVDAAQRQLLREGWMHNRARMITASFLCKDLLVDWRIGEAHFLSHLMDGDIANNNGGWQWAAGTGTDAQPYFRIFNPVTQGQKFDPEGAYVRQYVPELRAVPTKWIHHPWDMPDEAARDSGVEIGKDYPAPIVDHKQARVEALEWFAAHKRD